jgi:hypothetical protein
MKLPPKIKSVLSQLSDEVVEKYYGCGLTIPNELEGAHVLDLGCGSVKTKVFPFRFFLLATSAPSAS